MAINRRDLLSYAGAASLAPLLLFQGVGEADYPITTYHFQRDADGRVLAPFTLALPDERSFTLWFLFDTGADYSALFDIATSALNMEPVPLQSRTVMLSTGRQEVFIYKTKLISAFGNSLSDRKIAGIPARGAQRQAVGIIGTDLMHKHNILVDWDENTISAWTKDRVPDGYRWISARRVMARSLAVPLVVGDIEIPALVDTGATHSIINYPALDAMIAAGIAKRVQQAREFARIEAGWRAEDAEQAVIAHAAMGDNKSPGRLVFDNLDILAANLPVFRSLGAAKVPAAIIGMDILGQQNIIFDFQQGNLWV